jgi:hypothetical protein
MRLIPTRMHAVMDYVAGVVLIAAPWIFGFSDDSTAATVISVAAGIAMIGMSAVTAYEGGFLAHAIPMRMHLMADALVGIVLIASPWVFGFADEGANAWAPFVIIGAFELVAAASTVPESAVDDAREGVMHAPV